MVFSKKTLMRKIAEGDWRALKKASALLRNDKEVVLKAVMKNGCAL